MYPQTQWLAAEGWEPFGDEVERSLRKPLFGMKSLFKGSPTIRARLQESTKHSSGLPCLRRLHRKGGEITEAGYFLFLCKWKYPKHPQHVQRGEVRWTAAWNQALIHPFSSPVMNMDNGKSVDAENPRFLWIYRLIFLTSSSHFPPVRSDSTVGVKYYQIITGIFLPSVSFHGCRKRLQVSKA